MGIHNINLSDNIRKNTESLFLLVKKQSLNISKVIIAFLSIYY